MPEPEPECEPRDRQGDSPIMSEKKLGIYICIYRDFGEKDCDHFCVEWIDILTAMNFTVRINQGLA